MNTTTDDPVLLVVDDEPAVAALIDRFARAAGFVVTARNGGRTAIDELPRIKPAVALVDLQMPAVNGLQVLRAMREADPQCQVILMTAHATVDTAIEAVKLGAVDYLTKPFDFERLGALLTSVREEIARREMLLDRDRDLAKRLEFCGMIGRSAVMQELFALIRRVAPHLRTALISGETGTGKELAAHALHKLGPRSSRRFQAINCSAIVDTLVESELFGHVRGAFTGAVDAKPGLFERADGGTLFLDEIGELPLPAQAKLLRVLETGEVQRVGGADAKRVDVRVVAATNRNLRAEAAAGRFRSDLFYRLNIIEIVLPPLRERREDIPYLTAAFVQEFAGRFGKTLTGVSPAAERALTTAPWRGNVRELRNTLERACMLTDGKVLVEREVLACLTREDDAAPAVTTHMPLADGTNSQLLEDAERAHIQRVLAELGGNKQAAAARLGVSRRALYRRLDRLGLRTPPNKLARGRSEIAPHTAIPPDDCDLSE